MVIARHVLMAWLVACAVACGESGRGDGARSGAAPGSESKGGEAASPAECGPDIERVLAVLEAEYGIRPASRESTRDGAETAQARLSDIVGLWYDAGWKDVLRVDQWDVGVCRAECVPTGCIVMSKANGKVALSPPFWLFAWALRRHAGAGTGTSTPAQAPVDGPR